MSAGLDLRAFHATLPLSTLAISTLAIGIRDFASGKVHESGVLAHASSQEGYVFDYAAGVAPSVAVSLTMPVGNVQYPRMNTVHPIFEMNLPEGALREKLMRSFAKSVQSFDELALLAVVGHSQLGRLSFSPTTQIAPKPAVSVKQLMAHKGTEDLFADLLDFYAVDSGVSGMQPKVLLRDKDVKEVGLDRVSHKGATHIVKSFDPREYYELATNEFFCMMAARLTGFPTAQVTLSKSRRMLAVSRFDLQKSEHGATQYLGMEDFCVLCGLPSSARYDSSYEDLAQKIAIYTAPTSPIERHRALQQLFVTLVLSHVVGNGDAHLKNFAVLYATPQSNVTLAPIYDVVSTKAYVPRDSLALSLNGSKAFADRQVLAQFAKNSCGLTARKTQELFDTVARAAAQTITHMRRAMGRDKTLETVCSKLISIFEAGIAQTCH